MNAPTQSDPAVREALRLAAELIPIARKYFPKSIRHSDRFKLETTCAAIAKAISIKES